MNFEKYQHVERLESSEVDGILDGTVYLYTKMDGTNMGISLDSSGNMFCCSRNRVLSLTNDNAGSCKYVMNNDKFKQYLDKHPTHYLYGEFMVKHIIRTYLDSVWGKVFIFDVVDFADPENPRYLPPEEYMPMLREFDIETIPCIAKLENPTMDEVLSYMDKDKFMQKEGGYNEGLVAKNYNYKNKYGHTIWGKVVRAEYKARKNKPTSSTTDIEARIIETFCTDAFIEKEIDKLYSTLGTWENKHIGRYIGTVWHEFISENSWDMIKKFKNPKIDFSVLCVLCTDKTKNVMKSYFAKHNIEMPFH